MTPASPVLCATCGHGQATPTHWKAQEPSLYPNLKAAVHAFVPASPKEESKQKYKDLRARIEKAYGEISSWDDEWGLPDIRQMVLRRLRELLKA